MCMTFKWNPSYQKASVSATLGYAKKTVTDGHSIFNSSLHIHKALPDDRVGRLEMLEFRILGLSEQVLGKRHERLCKVA